MYSPESADSRKHRLCDDVYSVEDFISVEADDDVAVVPSGPFHVVLTDNEIFTSVLSSAIQVKVIEEPDNIGLGKSEWRISIGLGTVKDKTSKIPCILHNYGFE